MAQATILRPQCEINFTSLPNDIFNFGHHYDLKARDVAVLNYLLSKPEKWNINRKAIANAVNMCERTVSTALKVLQDLGFARFKRLKGGKTEWFISIPELEAKSLIAKNPIAQSAPCKIYPVLEKNKGLEINKETTNPAVVVSLPDYVNNGAVKQEMSALEIKTQQLVLAALAAAMTSGKVKSPIAYAMGLIKRAKDGLLSAPMDNSVDKKAEAVDKKTAFIRRNFERLREELRKRHFVHIKGIGNILMDDLKSVEV